MDRECRPECKGDACVGCPRRVEVRHIKSVFWEVCVCVYWGIALRNGKSLCETEMRWSIDGERDEVVCLNRSLGCQWARTTR